MLDAETGKQLSEIPGGPIEVLEINPNGRFAAGLSNQRLQTWTLEPPSAPETVADGVTCFAHSANGNYLVAGHADNKVRLWNLISRQADRAIDVDEPVTAVAIAPNGWLAFVGTERGQVLFIDLESATILAATHRHQEAIRSLAVSPDGEFVASVGDDSKILTWSTKDGRPRDFMPLDQPLHYASFIGSDWGVVGSRGGRLYCFHLPSRTAVSYGNPQMGQLQAVAISPDRRFVYAAFTELGLGRIDYDPPPAPPVVVQPPPPPPMPTPPVVKDVLQEAKVLVEQTLPKPNQAQRIRFAPDGQTLAASGSDGTLLLFSATANASPTIIANAADSQQSAWWVANKLVTTIGFIYPKDKSVAKHVLPQPASAVNTTGSTTSDLVILGLENGSVYRVKPNLPLYNSFWPMFNQRIVAAAMTRDGKQAVIANRDKLYLCPLDKADPQPQELMPHSGRHRWLSYLPGETQAICVDDKSAVLLDVREGKVLRNLPLQAAGSIRAAGVSADGSHVVVCVSDTVYALAIATGEVAGRLPLEAYTVVHGIDVSPDGRRLAVATEKKIIVWELPLSLNTGANP
jgi:WD40 repeat protein